MWSRLMPSQMRASELTSDGLVSEVGASLGDFRA